MKSVNVTLFGNPLTDWLLSIGLAAGVFCCLSLVIRFLTEQIPKRTKFAPHTKSLLESALRINLFLVLMVAIVVGLSILQLNPKVETFTRQIFFIAICLQLGIWASDVVWVFCVKADPPSESVRYRSSAHGLIIIVARMLIWIILFLLVLENFGVNITALIAGLGIGGVAMALAVQNILGDILGSISIVLDKPFELGDFIVIGDTMGSVENIGIKTTRLRSLGGEQIVLSNSSLLSGRIQNFKRMYERRVVFSFGVTYDTPNEKLLAISEEVEKILRSREKVRFDRAHFKEFGPSALVFEVVYFVLSPDFNFYMDIQQHVNLELKSHFERLGVRFALPTQVSIQAKTPSALV